MLDSKAVAAMPTILILKFIYSPVIVKLRKFLHHDFLHSGLNYGLNAIVRMTNRMVDR